MRWWGRKEEVNYNNLGTEMHCRQIIVNIIGCGVFGALLANFGYHLFTWQFWALFSIVLIIMVNSLIPKV